MWGMGGKFESWEFYKLLDTELRPWSSWLSIVRGWPASQQIYVDCPFYLTIFTEKCQGLNLGPSVCHTCSVTLRYGPTPGAACPELQNQIPTLSLPPPLGGCKTGFSLNFCYLCL